MHSPCGSWKSTPRPRPTTRTGASRTAAAGAARRPSRPDRQESRERQGRVPQKDELATRPQQPGRLRNPLVRVAPDRCAVLRYRQIERRVRKRHVLRVRLDQLHGESRSRAHPASRLELRGRNVDARHPSTALCEPRAEVGRPASELDHVLARTRPRARRARSRSGPNMPQVISSAAQASAARASVYSAFAFVQASRFRSR